MARKNEAHDLVMESLTQALLQLMETKPLAQINVSELCTRAGVGRVSFYRNFDSMEQILVLYLRKATDEWWVEFSQKPEDEFYATFWPELLEEYRKNEQLIKLLYENTASHLIRDHIFGCCLDDATDDETDAYLRAALAGAIYGMVDEWIRRGMKEMPKILRLKDIVRLMP